MKGKVFKIVVGLLLTISSIVPMNMMGIFAAESVVTVDDTQTTGKHYFTYSDAVDTSGLTGWAADKKNAISGDDASKTQHWV